MSKGTGEFLSAKSIRGSHFCAVGMAQRIHGDFRVLSIGISDTLLLTDILKKGVELVGSNQPFRVTGRHKQAAFGQQIFLIRMGNNAWAFFLLREE